MSVHSRTNTMTIEQPLTVVDSTDNWRLKYPNINSSKRGFCYLLSKKCRFEWFIVVWRCWKKKLIGFYNQVWICRIDFYYCDKSTTMLSKFTHHFAPLQTLEIELKLNLIDREFPLKTSDWKKKKYFVVDMKLSTLLTTFAKIESEFYHICFEKSRTNSMLFWHMYEIIIRESIRSKLEYNLKKNLLFFRTTQFLYIRWLWFHAYVQIVDKNDDYGHIWLG